MCTCIYFIKLNSGYYLCSNSYLIYYNSFFIKIISFYNPDSFSMETSSYAQAIFCCLLPSHGIQNKPQDLSVWEIGQTMILVVSFQVVSVVTYVFVLMNVWYGITSLFVKYGWVAIKIRSPPTTWRKFEIDSCGNKKNANTLFRI